MKKYVTFILITVFMAHFPQILTASIFSIKPSMGISYGGSISDRWAMTSNFFSSQTHKNNDSTITVNGNFELVFSILENFSLSVGGSYISRGFNGSRGVFSFPGTTAARGDFYMAPRYNFKAFSATLSAQWTFPLTWEINAYALGGVGYYFAKFDNTDKHVIYSDQFSDVEVYYFPMAFNGQANSLGFHGGAGVEFEMDTNIYFFAEARYRRVSFADIDKFFQKSEDSSQHAYVKDKLGENEAESAFIYYSNTSIFEEWGDIVYSIDRLILSDIIFSMGMRIGF